MGGQGQHLENSQGSASGSDRAALQAWMPVWVVKATRSTSPKSTLWEGRGPGGDTRIRLGHQPRRLC